LHLHNISRKRSGEIVAMDLPKGATEMSENNEVHELTGTDLNAVSGGKAGDPDSGGQLQVQATSSQTEKVSPSLFAHCATGKHIPEAKLT